MNKTESDRQALLPYPTSTEGFGLPEIDLRQLVDIIRRNLLLIGLILLAAIALGVLVTYLTTPSYVATSKVLVESEADQIVEGSQLKDKVEDWDVDRFLQTQVDIITSRTLVLRTVMDAGLANDPQFYAAYNMEMPEAADLPDGKSGAKAIIAYREKVATDTLLDTVNAERSPDSRIVEVSVTTHDPVYSAKLANIHTQSYIAGNLRRKFNSTDYARKYLTRQLEESRQRLSRSEQELNQYSRAAGLIRVSSQETDSSQNGGTLSVTNEALVQANQAANAATTARIAAQDAWRTVKDEPSQSLPQVLANSAVQQLLSQRSELEAQLAQERASHLDDYPTVRALKARIEELNARIEVIGSSIKRSLYLDFQSALQKEESLEGRVDELRDAALTEQDRGVQYTILKRVTDTNRAAYDALLERYNQLNAGAGAASNNITLIDPAQVPALPSSPRPFLNLAIAIFLGAVVAMLAVFVKQYFDDVVRSPEDVEAKLGLPMLGLIPRVEEQGFTEQTTNQRSAFNEAYHSLVANLAFSTSKGMPKSLLVTSAGVGQGKSTSSFMIASHYARLGHSVLLVDSDLRRPTVHKRLGKKDQPGLTVVLAGQNSLDEVLIRDVEQPSLAYLTGLPMPPQPSLLLGGQRLKNFMEEATSRFDLVVIDSPPMLGLSDAAQLASQVDGVLMMVDGGDFKRGTVKASLRRLRLVDTNVLGIVLTKFDPKNATGDYSYYGYDYYSYASES